MAVFTAMKFSDNKGGPLAWRAMRVLLALEFHVLPSEIDKLPFSEVMEMTAVIDGRNKAR
jgi:hypothetical protein